MACVTPARSSRGHTLNQSCSFTYPSKESQIVHYCIPVGLLLVLPLSIGVFSHYKIFLKTKEHQYDVVQSPQNRTENGSVTNSVKEININQVLLSVVRGRRLFVLLDTFSLLFQCFCKFLYLQFHKWHIPKALPESALWSP